MMSCRCVEVNNANRSLTITILTSAMPTKSSTYNSNAKGQQCRPKITTCTGKIAAQPIYDTGAVVHWYIVLPILLVLAALLVIMSIHRHVGTPVHKYTTLRCLMCMCCVAEL